MDFGAWQTSKGEPNCLSFAFASLGVDAGAVLDDNTHGAQLHDREEYRLAFDRSRGVAFIVGQLVDFDRIHVAGNGVAHTDLRIEFALPGEIPIELRKRVTAYLSPLGSRHSCGLVIVLERGSHPGAISSSPGSAVGKIGRYRSCSLPLSSAKPSSSQPVIPPVMIFTGRPSLASLAAARAAPLQ
jgi:hypothetical protein